jgi:hypothetical protein
MSAIDKVLDRLDGVKRTREHRWVAKCPAHLDKSPSLSIREMEDGRILVYDFGGCPAGDVLAAIGLRMADLFDKPIGHHLPPVRGGLTARELLELNGHESTVVAMLAHKAALGGRLTAEDVDRLNQAADRLGRAAAAIQGRG